jgi:hypothetical protein
MNKATISILAIAAICLACSPEPVDIQFSEDMYVVEGKDGKIQIKAWPVDKEGNKIEEGVDLTYFCPNRDIIGVTNDGEVNAIASGEDDVEVEVVGKPIKKSVKVRVKIAGGVEASHEKLRLWVGQEKTDVAAHVISEKGAYIEGYLPEWRSDDPSIVSVERIPDPTQMKFKRSYVKMVGKKSGDTHVYASYNGMEKQITVRVYAEDDEVTLAGRRISDEEKKEMEAAKAKAKK